MGLNGVFFGGSRARFKLLDFSNLNCSCLQGGAGGPPPGAGDEEGGEEDLKDEL